MTHPHRAFDKRAGGILATVLLAGAAAAFCAEATTAPAKRPGNITAEVRGKPTAATAPADVLDLVEARLRLSEVEKQALLDAQASPLQLDEPAFGIMLAKVAGLPVLDENDFSRLDHPAVRNLARSPQRYHGAPIRLTVRAYQVRKYTPGKDISISGHWPREKPFWRMNCTSALPKARREGDEDPLIVFTTLDPTELLGRPKEGASADDELRYPHGPKIELAGVFYKIRRVNERDSGEPRDYPVVLAWQMLPGQGWVRDTVSHMAQPVIIILLVVILVMAVAFVFISRRIRKGMSPQHQGHTYEPMRFQMPEGAGGANIEDAEPAGPAGPRQVDPLLAAAAEEYQKELHDQRSVDTEQDNGTDRTS